MYGALIDVRGMRAVQTTLENYIHQNSHDSKINEWTQYTLIYNTNNTKGGTTRAFFDHSKF